MEKREDPPPNLIFSKLNKWSELKEFRKFEEISPYFMSGKRPLEDESEGQDSD